MENGHGDVIKELADACVKQNMPLGVYLSPWIGMNPDMDPMPTMNISEASCVNS